MSTVPAVSQIQSSGHGTPSQHRPTRTKKLPMTGPRNLPKLPGCPLPRSCSRPLTQWLPGPAGEPEPRPDRRPSPVIRTPARVPMRPDRARRRIRTRTPQMVRAVRADVVVAGAAAVGAAVVKADKVQTAQLAQMPRIRPTAPEVPQGRAPARTARRPLALMGPVTIRGPDRVGPPKAGVRVPKAAQRTATPAPRMLRRTTIRVTGRRAPNPANHRTPRARTARIRTARTRTARTRTVRTRATRIRTATAVGSRMARRAGAGAGAAVGPGPGAVTTPVATPVMRSLR